MAKQKRNWWSCKNAIGTSSRWSIPNGMLVKGELYDNYCCSSSEVIVSGNLERGSFIEVDGCTLKPAWERHAAKDA